MTFPRSTPFQLADRTPLVLTTERLASLSPPSSRGALRGEIADAAALGCVWLLFGLCLATLAAGALVLGAAALAGGAS